MFLPYILQCITDQYSCMKRWYNITLCMGGGWRCDDDKQFENEHEAPHDMD